MESIGRAAVARPEGPGFFSNLIAGITNVLRLIVPILALLVAGAAAFVYANVPAPVLTGMIGPWFTLGLALVPVTFFVIQLTARRYGFGYAFLQVVGAWAAFVALATFAQTDFKLPFGGISYDRTAVAFGASLMLMQIFAALVFHGLRGPRWWSAPLFSTLIAGMLFSLIAFPAAFAGTGMEWVSAMGAYVAFTTAASIAMLIPYWIMRPLLPPLPGFGGY